jgi:hypothetical protein
LGVDCYQDKKMKFGIQVISFYIFLIWEKKPLMEEWVMNC